MDIMYELPEQRTLKRVLIDEDVVAKNKPPILEHEMQKSA
jgi:ATP-dependent Clp protease ATP-binding subunit ClpX